MSDKGTPAVAGGREHFASRLGFILISAGCAIGLGNVWRFPYITGEYGGGAFVLMYLVFLLILGLPVLVMEFTVGRASQRSLATAFQTLKPEAKGWNFFSGWGFIGCMLLMMFYTTVAGWMLAFTAKMATGTFNGLEAEEVAGVFGAMLANPAEMIGWLVVVCVIGLGVCSLGLQKGVERITKVMMLALLAVMVVLVVRAATLPGGIEGLKFYLLPDFDRMFAGGWSTFADAVYAAMGQAFFTLSLGIGSMEIFGSYLGKDHSLTGEAVRICGLDTFVALTAGLIIFPACFAFGVNPDSGPSLVFITLPSVFSQMPLGQVWGALFFVFMSFAALSTVIAVFENIIRYPMDKWDWTRKKAVAVMGVAIFILSIPCALGFNVLSFINIPGIGDIQGIEDFIVSNNMLPLGALIFVLFCVTKRGWGWENFLAEADAGQGLKFPRWALPWIKYGIPVLIVVIFVMGWLPKIMLWLGLA